MKPGNRVEDKTLKTGEILACEECLWQRTRRLTDGHTQLTQSRSHLMSSLDVPMFAVGTWEAVDERRWRHRQGAELELTRRNNPLSMYQIIQALNEYLRGWVSYFKTQEFRNIFRDLDGWIRSRLRSMQLKKWKKPRKFQKIMIRSGFKPHEAHRVWVKMNRWQSVNRKEVRFVMNLQWFRRRGLIFLNDFTQRQVPLELRSSR